MGDKSGQEEDKSGKLDPTIRTNAQNMQTALSRQKWIVGGKSEKKWSPNQKSMQAR